ncbi:hypothetical protein H4217_000773 [Coemansia sp. RSA 1939]|nr:hypothetical protein H4217_000773 [Coemansia sp. RSA 1939]
MSSTGFPFLKSGYTVYANHLCPFSMHVRRALKAVGATHQTVEIDLSNKPSWYSQVNPKLLVPALRTPDGTVVTESMGIIEHVVGAFPSSKLIPEDPAQRTRLYDFINIIDSRFRPSVYKSLMASDPDAQKASIDLALSAVREASKALEDQWALPGSNGGPFWLDARFGFAEIVLSSSVSVLGVLRHYRGVEIPDTQAYAAFLCWYSAFKSDPLFTEFEPDFEEQVVTFKKIVA